MKTLIMTSLECAIISCFFTYLEDLLGHQGAVCGLVHHILGLVTTQHVRHQAEGISQRTYILVLLWRLLGLPK